MGEPSDEIEFVYVPRQPGPLVRPAAEPAPADEIDDVLDDLFGDDDRGPSTTDAVLVVAGVAAVAAGRLADLPVIVTVVGIALIGLGAILPIRSAVRRLAARRARSRTRATIGDGVPLRHDDALLRRLADLHDRVHVASASLGPDRRSQVVAVAHALVDEVATLLDGGLPAGAAEVEYVDARAAALTELAVTIEDPRVGDGDAIERTARTQARLEIEEVSGRSALRDSAELLSELRPGIDD